MTRKRPDPEPLVKGTAAHRRTETDYMGALLDAVTLEDWREVIGCAVTLAKQGDGAARAWLAQYLVGKPELRAPSPLTVVVTQLSGADPLVDKLAQPHLSRARYPELYRGDEFDASVKATVAAELRALLTPPQDEPAS